MFKNEILNKNIDSFSNLSLNESVSTMVGLLTENNIDIAETILKYNQVFADTMNKNGNTFNDEVKTILGESSVDILTKLIDGTQNAVSILKQFSEAISAQCKTLVDQNKGVVDKYRPLLKHLDTTKFSYTTPKYDLDTLKNRDIISRFLSYLDVFKASQDSDFQYSTAGKDLLTKQWSAADIMKDIQYALLGTSKTTRMDFYELVSTTICNPSLIETKYFGDDIFTALCEDVSLLLDFDVIFNLFSKELFGIIDFRDDIMHSKSRDHYYDSIRVRKYVSTNMVLYYAAGLVAEIIQEKYRLLCQRSTYYRKIVINAYEQTSSGATSTETYNPINDMLTEILHDECCHDDSNLF